MRRQVDGGNRAADMIAGTTIRAVAPVRKLTSSSQAYMAWCIVAHLPWLA